MLLSVFPSSGPTVSLAPLSVPGPILARTLDGLGTLSAQPTSALTARFHPLGELGTGEGSFVGTGVVMVTKTVSHVGLSNSGMLVVTTTGTGNLGEGGDSPIFVMPPPNFVMPSSQAGFGAAALSPGSFSSAQAGKTDSLTDEMLTGSGRRDTATSASTDPATVAIPAAPDVQMDGNWAGPLNAMELHIAVGPTTRSVGLTIQPGSNNALPGGPVVTGLTLIDRDGDTLATIGPIWNSQTNSPVSAVIVSVNGAPFGGTLVVQLASAATEGAPTGTTTTGTGLGGSVPFLLDVQQVDSLPSFDVTGGAVLLGVQGANPNSGIGALQGLTSQATTQAGSSWGSSGGSSSESAPVLVVNPSLAVSPGDEAAGLISGDSTDFSGRIALGPLASRSAAPMGPNLVSAWLDATPAVDRHERGTSQAIEDRAVRIR